MLKPQSQIRHFTNSGSVLRADSGSEHSFFMAYRESIVLAAPMHRVETNKVLSQISFAQEVFEESVMGVRRMQKVIKPTSEQAKNRNE